VAVLEIDLKELGGSAAEMFEILPIRD